MICPVCWEDKKKPSLEEPACCYSTCSSVCESCLDQWFQVCEKKNRGLQRASVPVPTCPICRTSVSLETAASILGRAFVPAKSSCKAGWQSSLGDPHTEQWLAEHRAKPCGGCGAWIVKDGGCGDMTCWCGHRFCWHCGASGGLSGRNPCNCENERAWQSEERRGQIILCLARNDISKATNLYREELEMQQDRGPPDWALAHEEWDRIFGDDSSEQSCGTIATAEEIRQLWSSMCTQRLLEERRDMIYEIQNRTSQQCQDRRDEMLRSLRDQNLSRAARVYQEELRVSQAMPAWAPRHWLWDRVFDRQTYAQIVGSATPLELLQLATLIEYRPVLMDLQRGGWRLKKTERKKRAKKNYRTRDIIFERVHGISPERLGRQNHFMKLKRAANQARSEQRTKAYRKSEKRRVKIVECLELNDISSAASLYQEEIRVFQRRPDWAPDHAVWETLFHREPHAQIVGTATIEELQELCAYMIERDF